MFLVPSPSLILFEMQISFLMVAAGAKDGFGGNAMHEEG
jgi:hypothetical protein